MAADHSMMQAFFDYGVVSEVSLPLAELEGKPDQCIHITRSMLAARESVQRHEWDESVTPRMYGEKRDDEFDLVFEGILRARVSPALASSDRLDVEIQLMCDDDAAVAHLIVDQLLPRMLGQRGELVLHAGAVALGDSAFMFLGESGSGKSTLCASFHDDGWQVLSDDCVRILSDSGTVEGSYPGLRLYGDSMCAIEGVSQGSGAVAGYSDKQRVSVDLAQQESPHQVSAIFLLEPGHREIELERIGGSAAMIALLQESFSLWPGDSTNATSQLLQVSRLLDNNVPVFRCCFDHDYEQLPEIKNRIREFL